MSPIFKINIFKLLTRLILAVVILIAITNLYKNRSRKRSGESNQQQTKSVHFLDSTPLANDIYAAQPINVTLNFNTDLTKDSKLSVTSLDKIGWTEGETLIEDNNTVLLKNLKQGMPNGQYFVSYSACFESENCEDGQFTFNIDTAKQAEYQDLRGKKQITIAMKDIKFELDKIIISPGTKVTWENEEQVGHFVNTETHPEHTCFPLQNSREILQSANPKSSEFSVIFKIPGQYNYHCSAHVPQNMLGSIIVVN